MILKSSTVGCWKLPARMTRSDGDVGSWLPKAFGMATGIFIIVLFSFSTCKYGFKDTSPIPVEIKTFRVNYLENKATYVNPQISPQLTEKLKQKIIGTTRLRQSNMMMPIMISAAMFRSILPAPQVSVIIMQALTVYPLVSTSFLKIH